MLPEKDIKIIDGLMLATLAIIVYVVAILMLRLYGVEI